MASFSEIIPTYLQSPFLLFLFLPALLIFLPFGSWIHHKQRKKHSSIPTNWPVIGMLPAVLRHAHRLHDYGTEVLTESGGTFEFRGPWFTNLDMIVTADPSDIHHIMSRNFSNYPKGPEFRKIFDILGDGIFNADSGLWEIHRRVTLSIMHSPGFQKLMQEKVFEKMAKGLFPVLECFANKVIDLQDFLQRFTFDVFSSLLLDYDPGTMSLDLPMVPAQYAFFDAERGQMQRHFLPERCWKLQKWLGLGKEQKLGEAWDNLDDYIFPCIEKKQDLLLVDTDNQAVGEMKRFDGLTAFIQAYKAVCSSSESSPEVTKKFLRDVFLSLLVAGRDTISTALSWFFFLLAKNPSVESMILQEIKTKLNLSHKSPILCNSDESRNLVYLHGALCETLRLFPPVALEHKAPTKADFLPSGLHINANTKVVLFFYSMGRMESIWGKDCMDFKPERWITDQGRIRHEPSFKFPAFNAGPRTCLGKDIAFVQMKMVAASIICNYHVQLVESHPVVPSDSVIIQIKDGLKVKLSKRM